MAKIEELKIGTLVRYRDRQGLSPNGKIVGRIVNGCIEGDVDPDGYTYERGQKPDRVKIAFPEIGVPPETISVSCSPAAVELSE